MIKKLLTPVALVACLALAACDDSGTNAGNGTMSLMLTDEAGDFTQAVVTIERIELVGSGPPMALRDVPFTTNLLTLSNDIATLVEDYPVPNGTYTELRLIIPEACIGVEQEDGSELVYASNGFEDCGDADGGLELPSFAETGIKVNLPGGMLEVQGDQRILLLDFDVSQSFGQQAGSSGTWVMTPVINADDMSLSGSIVINLTAADGVDLGAMGSSLADFEARLAGETEAQAFTDPDEDGVFAASFLFLLPGADYEVHVGLREGVSYSYTLDPTEAQTLTLGSGEEAAVAFEVTSASSP